LKKQSKEKTRKKKKKEYSLGKNNVITEKRGIDLPSLRSGSRMNPRTGPTT